MAKTKISEFSATPANNTDIDSINISEGCAPSGINDAIRELMAQLKDFQTGAQGDSFNGPIGTSTAAAGAFTTLSATGAITSTLATGTAPLVIASTTKVSNLNVDLLDGADWASPAALGSTTPAAVSATTLAASGAVTLSGGTANGVAYLNGSKVVTSGSALTFDGSNLVNGGNFSTGTSGLATYFRASGTAYTQIGDNQTLGAGTAFVIGSSTPYLAGNVGGSEQMRLTQTGLGIGTSSPSAKLNVFAGGVVARFGAFGTTTYDDFQIESYAGSTGIGCRGSSNLYFAMNGTTRMYLTSSGNFGIGTSAPIVALQVNSGSSFVGGFKSTVANGYIALQDSGTSGALTDGNVAIGAISNDLAFRSGGATRMRLDSAGNLGLGVAPSVWGSNYRALTIATGSGAISSRTDAYRLFASTNAYHDGTNWRYVASTFASLYAQDSSQHIFYTAPSGTAGTAITFTQAMTLDSSGNLGVGTTSIPTVGSTQVLAVGNSNGGTLGIVQSGSIVYRTSASTSGVDFYTGNAVPLSFYTSGSERARIDSSGNFLVGAISPLVNAGGRGNITVNGSTDAVLSFGIGGSTAGYLYQGPSTLIVNTQGARAITFENNGTERARIDSSGNLLVGATSQFGGADCKLQGKNGSSAQAVSFLWNATTTGDANFVAFGTEATVTQRGSITYNRVGGLTAYNTTSDYRAKDISGLVTDSGVLIDSVPVYMGKMKGATQERPMFIAHETPAYAHTGEKDAVDTDGNPVYQQMDASALIPVMWAEIQSLRKRLADAGL